MTDKPSKTFEFVVDRIEMGWALVDPGSWSYINDQLDSVAAVERCTTWGEFRVLGIDDEEILEFADEQNGVDGTLPGDDEAFSFDLSDSEWYERSLWLARATTDALSELPDEILELVRVGDEISFVEDDRLEALITALQALGHTVRRIDG